MKSLLRYLAYSCVSEAVALCAVALLTVAAPGHSLATGVLLVTLSGLRELCSAAQLRRRLADSLLRRLPFDLK